MTVSNTLRRPAKISHSIVLVTPDMAKRWLEDCNPRNREIKEGVVLEYAADMEAGRWPFTAETIQFDWNGNLLNGQHRLSALFLTGSSLPFLIVRGLDPETQIAMDQGSRRSPRDQLNLAGIVADNTIAAAMRIYITWTEGNLFSDKRRVKLTTSELVQWAQANSDLVNLLSDLSAAGIRKAPCAPSIALAVALRLSLIDEAACLQFFDKLVSLDGISGPILALHKRLDKSRTSHVRLSQRDVIGYFIQAWNAYRDNRRLSKLQRPDGATWTPRNFPLPH